MQIRRAFPLLLAFLASLTANEGSLRATDVDRRPTSDVIEEFTVGKEGRPLILPVQLLGHTYHFLVDTGSSRTVYDSRFRDVLGAPIGETTIETPGGHLKTDLFACPRASIGKIEWPSTTSIVCTDLTLLKAATGERVDGVIGMDVLKDYVLKIDFDAGLLRLSSADTKRAAEWGESIPISFAQRSCPLVRARLSATVDEEFLVDTGANVNCLNSPTFSTLHKDRKLRLFLSSHRALTTYGQVTGQSGFVDSISIGTLRNQWLRFDAGPKSLLGLRFLSRYVVTLDFPNQCLYLKPGRRYTEGHRPATSGLAVVWIGGAFVVHSVQDQSPADRAGIKHGDIVVRVNGNNASKYDIFALGKVLTTQPGSEVSLTLRRGEMEIDAVFLPAAVALEDSK